MGFLAPETDKLTQVTLTIIMVFMFIHFKINPKKEGEKKLKKL